MKLITLEKVLHSLRDMRPQVKVAETIRDKAGAAIDRMLAASSRGGIRGDTFTGRRQIQVGEKR